MIRINLIPFEERQRPKRMALPGTWSLVIYGLVIAFVISGKIA